MKKTWLTSDHHFGHKNIIKYCNRPFKDIEEMNRVMIERWNEVVAGDDRVYHLGDFTLNGKMYAEMLFQQLKGDIVVLPGSHDQNWYGKRVFFSRGYDGVSLAVSMAEPLVTIVAGTPNVDGIQIILCHYAMRVWPQSHYGTFHAYGHSHGNLPGLGRSMDVGVDAHNFYPIEVEDFVSRLRETKPFLDNRERK